MPSYSKNEQIKGDLNIKLRFERDLLAKMRKLGTKQTTLVARTVDRTGNLPDLDVFTPVIEKMLNVHFQKVGVVFVNRVNKLVSDAAKDLEEKKSLETKAARVPLVISRSFQVRAAEQARRITETSKKNARLALKLAQEAALDTSIVGVTELNVSDAVGSIYRIHVNGRAKGIARLNTNAPAELAKLTQIQILRGEQPSIAGGNSSKTHKEWNNMGDSSVRTPLGGAGASKFDHLIAEQRVLSHKPFIVSGQKLRHPGDTSLGASFGNVANCRCSATYDIVDVARAIGN